jgi:RNA polymerase sigma factor (sigma-70 family)
MLKDKKFIQKIVNSESRFFNYFNSIAKNSSIANDLVQEVFLTAYRQYVMGLYIEKGKLDSYLMKIAANVLKDYFRKKKYREGLMVNYEIDIYNNLGWSEPTCDYLTETIKETDVQIRDNVAGNLLNKKFNLSFLNSKEQHIMQMRHGDNFSFLKMSETLNMPIATVAFKYKFAIKKIRDAILKGVVR